MLQAISSYDQIEYTRLMAHFQSMALTVVDIYGFMFNELKKFGHSRSNLDFLSFLQIDPRFGHFR